MLKSNSIINNNAPDTCRQNQIQTNIYWDSCTQVDLNIFEEHLQRLAAARAAIESSLHAWMAARNIPHSPAIDLLISRMSLQNKIALIHRNLGFSSKHEELIKDQLAALECSSAALAEADYVIDKFLRRPSRTDPGKVYAVALALEMALSKLEAK